MNGGFVVYLQCVCVTEIHRKSMTGTEWKDKKNRSNFHRIL